MQRKSTMYFLALTVVGLNVGSSIVLKSMADQSPDFPFLVLGFGLVAFLNVLRLLTWYLANRNFPLSVFHPLTSLIFPVIMLVALAYGETIRYPQVAGALLICVGVILLGNRQFDQLVLEER